MSNIEIIKGLGILREIRLSASFCEKVNDQSCDCDGIILTDDQGAAYLTYRSLGEDGCVEINPVRSYIDLDYPFFVNLEHREFQLDEICYYDDGSIEGIRFRSDDTFLFVFGSEYNLILTISKYDLFETIDMDFPKTNLHFACFASSIYRMAYPMGWNSTVSVSKMKLPRL